MRVKRCVYACACMVERLKEEKEEESVRTAPWLGLAMLEQENKEEAREDLAGKQQIQSGSHFICRGQNAPAFICLHLAPYCTPESSLEERCYKCQVLR